MANTTFPTSSLPIERFASGLFQRLREIDSQRAPAPTWLMKSTIPIFYTLSTLLLLPSPGLTRVILGYTVFTSIWLSAYINFKADPSFFLDAIFMFSYTYRWLLMVSTGEPETDFWQTSPTPTKLLQTGPWYAVFWAKLKWSAELVLNWRGIKWNYEYRGMHKSWEQSQSRLLFLLENAARIYIGMQVQKYIMQGPFCIFWPQDGVKFAFFSLPALHRHFIVFCQLCRDWIMLDTLYRQVAFVGVAFFLSTPDRWPPYNGKLAEMYTVRNFWGRGWHQTFRVLFTSTSKLVVKAFNFPPNSIWAKYTSLYVGFLVSGVQHGAIALWILSPGYGWALFWQMPAYAAVITAEDFLQFLGAKIGLQDSVLTRLLGYAWTLYWMTRIYGWVTAYHTDVGSFDGVCLPS